MARRRAAALRRASRSCQERVGRRRAHRGFRSPRVALGAESSGDGVSQNVRPERGTSTDRKRADRRLGAFSSKEVDVADRPVVMASARCVAATARLSPAISSSRVTLPADTRFVRSREARPRHYTPWSRRPVVSLCRRRRRALQRHRFPSARRRARPSSAPPPTRTPPRTVATARRTRHDPSPLLRPAATRVCGDLLLPDDRRSPQTSPSPPARPVARPRSTPPNPR